MYCIFGSSKDITVGPTAIMSLMTAEYAATGHGSGATTPPELATLLAFTTGIVIFLFGILKFGFLIEFFSVPVIAGFTSAAAISIASGQVDKILGLKIKNSTDIPGVVGDYVNIFENIDTFRWQDFVLGTISMVLLLLLRVRTTQQSCILKACTQFFCFFNPLFLYGPHLWMSNID